MTKQEVLQGALTLGGEGKKYTVAIEGDTIIIEARYRGSYAQISTFRCIARLNDNRTYTETTYNFDARRIQCGVRIKTACRNSDGTKEFFDSKEVTALLRNYLEGCGYKRRKNLGLIALCIAVPIIAATLMTAALILLLAPHSEFIDTNGPDNYALTEISRNDIIKPGNNYTSAVVSKNSSGNRTNIVGKSLRDYDHDKVGISFGRFHGVMTLQATRISGDTLTLNINCSIESGNAEIVILVDGKFYCSVDVNQSSTVTLRDISNKEVVVKLAGEGAKMKIDVTRVY